MPDVFTKKKRSDVMSRIRSRGNKETEIVLAKLLRRHHLTGWRRHIQIRSAKFGVRKDTSPRPSPQRGEGGNASFRVRPDFIFREARLALFVDGCFWHACPRHANLPVNNRPFWRKKLAVNRVRDILVTRRLRRLGWRVVRLWEHELRDEARCLQKIVRVLGQ